MHLLLMALPLLLAAPDETGAPPGCAAAPVRIVEGLGSWSEELTRDAQLGGDAPATPMLIRRAGARLEGGCGPAVRLLPVQLDAVFNTTYPSGANDGLLWAGRGLSTSLSAGVAARWRWLSAAIAPAVAWQQNAWFETPSNGQDGDLAWMSPWYGASIDLPLRFGAGPFASAGFGQSYVRADAFNVAVGLSTENLWLGPGLRNSLLMSSAAPGVPHAFLGTSRPADVLIGRLEALAFWGWLDRSAYFPEGGRPLLSGLILTFEPRWVPGLFLGAGRVFVQPGTGLQVRDYFAFLQSPWKGQTDYWSPTGDNPEDNQIGALWFRWVFPASGLELFGEWGKEDYSGTTINSFMQDPSWTQAWLLGLQKRFRVAGGWLRVHVEATHLQELRGPPNPSWYTHGGDLGYTNEGQPLGAGIGPGGDAQTLAVDWLRPSGRIGAYVERIARNEGYYWTNADPAEFGAPGPGHDVEVSGAVRQLLFAGPLEISWEVGVQRRWNRDYLEHEVNGRAAVKVTARFDGPQRAAAEAPAAPVEALVGVSPGP
jgi:hypothetical protein